MKKIKSITSFFEIQIAFVLVAFLMIALGYTEQFFIMLICITMHEMTHVLTAYLFGCKTKRVLFTALGETAVIENMDVLKLCNRNIILLAGPTANIILGLCSLLVFGDKKQFILINFSLALFNLLPVYPLDGGRILLNILGEAVGVINSHKIIVIISRFICGCFTLCGLAQVVLYPYNISLICISIYIAKINKRQYILNIFEFYKIKLSTRKSYPMSAPKITPALRLVVQADLPVSNLVARLSYNRFYFISVISNNTILHELDELQLIKYISVYGANKTVGELCDDILCK